jgi:cobalt/nickel transport system ATP-binding protein
MDSNSIQINLSEVTFSYPDGKTALDGLNFQLKGNERVGLVGANGSGKTTMLQIIIGLLRPGSGSVEIFGEQRTSEKDFYAVREKIGFLFQDPDDQLFSPTVIEDVAFGPLNLGKSKTEAFEISRRTLALTGLDEKTVERISELLAGLPHPRVIVSHDREFLERVTNEMLTMQKGKIVRM